MKYRLGIDLGTSSIGVAAYELNEKNEIKDLIYLDSYIFGEPINPKMSVTLNTDRRSARLARRQIERKAKRLRKMAYIAESIGVTKKELDAIKDKDVIKLRAEALSHKITLPELIKVFSHIVKNRGYKGNLKALEKLEKQNVEDSETEDKKAKNSNDVSDKIYATQNMLNGKTLGEILYEKKETAGKNAPWRKLNEDGTFITRDIVVDEFNKIWEEQIKYHKELDNNYTVFRKIFPDHTDKEEVTLKEAFKSAMFYQRPIKWKLSTVGNCILEEDEYRAAKAQPKYQQCRLASNISDLKIKNIDSKTTRHLTREEIEKIYIYVYENFNLYNSRSKIPYKFIYEELGLKDNEKFTIDCAKGDTAKEDGLKGITTLQSFYNCDKEDSKFIDAFNSLSDKAQEIAIEYLANITKHSDIQENEESYIDKQFDIREEDNLVQNIKNATDDDYEKAKAFIKMLRKKDIFYNDKFYLEKGRSSYSVKAIERIIPELLKGENEQNIIANLYPPKSETQKNSVLRDHEKLMTNNPIIDKVLREYQRTMNYIVKRLGANPTEMTIELTRELKNSLAKRKYIEKQNEIAQAERTKAKKELKENGIFLGGENIEKYLLLQEQDELCPYCGQRIKIEDIVNNTQIDHIIPRSKGGPNIYANKVLAHTSCNHEKGDRIPYEYKFGDDIEEYINFLSEKKKTKKSEEKSKSEFGKQSTLINFVQSLWKKYMKESRGYKRRGKWVATEKGKRLWSKRNFILIKPDEVESVVEKYSKVHLDSIAWVNKIILDWSKDICPKVTPSYGILTAYLRDKWNYNEILPLVRIKENKKLYDIKGVEIKKKKWEELFTKKDLEFSESEALKEDFKEYINSLPKEEKPLNDTDKQKYFKYFCQNLRQDNKFDKRCDYRHHAIDAAIIGLSTLSLIQQASDHNKKYGGLYGVKNEKGEVTVPHFEIKKEDALLYKRIKERIEEYLTNFIVWHKPDRTPNGKFFEETAYNVKEINGEKRFTIRQTLEKILGKENNCDDFIKKLEEVIVGEEIKNDVIKQLKERLNNGMSLKEAFLEKDIVFRGNKIKKLKVFYKERGFIQFYDGIDVNIVSKYYQNAGYACMDFDKNTGKVKYAIPLWRFNANNLMQDNVPQDTVRIFINDIVFDKKSKEFYRVTSFRFNKYDKHIKCRPVSDNIKPEKTFSCIKDIILCKNRADIVKVKKEYGK